MSKDVIFQGKMFLMAAGWGCTLMAAYDCLRIVRLLFGYKKWIFIVEECVFWIVCSAVIFALIYRYNSGAVRNYIVMGMAAGMIMYGWLLSPVIMHLAGYLKKPVRRLKDIMHKIHRKIKNPLKILYKKVKIRKSIRVDRIKKYSEQGEKHGR